MLRGRPLGRLDGRRVPGIPGRRQTPRRRGPHRQALAGKHQNCVAALRFSFCACLLKFLGRLQEIRIESIRFFSISFLWSSGIMPSLGAGKIRNLVDLEKGTGNREGASGRDEKRTRVGFFSHR